MNILDFTFNGKKLSDFECICCNFDSSSGTVEVSSGADVTLNQEKPSGSNKFNLYSTSYDEPFTLSLSICLNPCRDHENMEMSVEQARKIQKWLSLRNKKFKLDVIGFEDIYWVGTFTSKQVMLNSSIIGFNLTFTANTPYALQENELFNIELSDTLESDIVFTSDVYGYIDADYVITVKEAGDLKFDTYYYNPDTKVYILDREFTVKNCFADEKIYVKGDTQLVTSSRTVHELGKDCNFILPRLVNTYQSDDEEVRNKIKSNLKCNVQITYNPTAMIGYGYKS